MNKNQLERIRHYLDVIKGIIREDTQGALWVNQLFDKLYERVIGELKGEVWAEYEEKRKTCTS